MGTLGSRSLFHMGNAVRLAAEDARGKTARARRRSRIARRHQLSAGGDFQEALRHAGRQCHRHGEFRADLQIARRADRAVGQRDAVLDDRRCRRRGRGRYRDRPRARDEARQRRRLRQADQSRRGAHAASRRRHHAARLHAVRRSCSSTAARSPTLRSPTTRSPASATFRRWRTNWSRPSSIPARSAPRARRVRHLRRVAGDRQRHPRRRRRAHHGTADHRRSGAARLARTSRPAHSRTNDEHAQHQFHAQRPSRSRPRSSRIAIWSSCCSASICSARAKAAARGCAAAAPCWSTTRRCPAAFISRPGSTARASPRSNRSMPMARCRLCSRPSSIAARSSAASARRASC